MVTLVWRTDVHLADLPPQSRTDDWASTLLEKLGQVGAIARQVDAAAVLDGGDLFHIKSPSRTSHELVQRVAEVHQKYPCPTFGNVGNHDVKYGDLQFLNEAPLGVLFRSGVIQPCYNEFEVFFGPGPTPRPQVYPHNQQGWVKGNPFALRKTAPIVRVVGIPYHGTSYDMNRFTTLTKGPEDYLVVMVHCLASKQGGSMFEGEDIIKYGDLANLDPDVWCFGHWHKDQGITEIAPGKSVVNVGSLSRGSISQDDTGRTPSCVTLEFSLGGPPKITQVPLQVAPASQIFDLVGKARSEVKRVTVDALVESIQSVLLDRGGQSLLEDVRALKDVPDLVRERTLAYLEKAGSN